MSEDRKPGRVLFVEDDKFMVRMYQVRLSAEGFDVETAMNGQECLEKAAASSPDVILLDLSLPVMNGFVALEKLKANGNTASIPVIVFSNRSTPEDILKARQLGAIDYLVKVNTPPEDVIRKINNAINKSSARPSQPNRYLLAVDWNALDAKQMVQDLGIPIEYRGGRCITEMLIEAMPEHSHQEPWILGRFIPKKKPQS